MYREGSQLRFSPSDLSVFWASEFAAWMDRWELEHAADPTLVLPLLAKTPPASGVTDLPLFAAAPAAVPLDVAPDAPDADAQLLLRKGREHEHAVLAAYRAQARAVQSLIGAPDREAATRAAIAAGVDVIYQARLRDADFVGEPDFLLRRADGERVFYEPAEAKLAQSAKPEHVVQLCAYADLLAELQGVRPPELELALGDGRHERLATDAYFHYYRQLRRSFLEFQRRFDARHMPHPGASSNHGRWSGCAERIVAHTDHVRGVANIRGSQIRALDKAGIVTMTALAGLPEPMPAALRGESWQRLRAQARLQLASRGADSPLYEVVPPAFAAERRGLALLPAESELDVAFDMEGHPLPEGQLEYLFGAVHVEAGEVRFADWWALQRADERSAFEGCVDWLYDRWQRDPAMHVYHYNVYETAAVKRLMGQYGTREREVDELLRAEVFVDLYRVVRQGLVIGTSGYSLKDIEPLYRPARAGSVKTAQGCMAAFERWRDTPDGASWRDSPVLRDIRAYNRVDCESTRDLGRWLRQVQAQAALHYVPPGMEIQAARRAAPAASRSRRAAATAASAAVPGDTTRPGELALGAPQDPGQELARLLAAHTDDDEVASPAPEAVDDDVDAGITARLAARAAADPDAAAVAGLLGDLLEFHRREMKPEWWRMFDRGQMSSDELENDLECLAGLERTAAPPRRDGRFASFEYRFSPDQETKLEAGKECRTAHDLDARVRLVELDLDLGRAWIQPLQRIPTPPPLVLDLLPDPTDRSGVLKKAIQRYATAWADGDRPSPAVDDFLHRRAPRLLGHDGGPLLLPGEDVFAGFLRLVERLQQSTLCVQGPPGTGKTYNASRVILELLRAGRRVGVMANSHKAILNLMGAVMGCAEDAECAVRAVKVRGEATDAWIETGRLEHLKENSDAARALESGGDATAEAIAAADDVEILPGRLVGGTAWLFARPELEQRFDYLFVDEAGQVAVANLVAAGMAARNLVLLGDQMQLAQPTKGSHPGDSGKSTLDYLLQNHATIPEDFGVFLATTHRMHPEVCAFVSEAVYEGRLHPDPKTALRRLVLPAPAAGVTPLVTRGTGLRWVPVEHHDNAQASEEEAEVVVRLVEELLAASFRDATGDERPMTLQDILIVAPYNMQVRLLQRRLPDAARVGSVDRFQGLEAPAVIVSMCASSLDDVPRGLEFLLSPNRINVAISRAQCTGIVVGSPAILASRATSLEQMRRLDLYCRLVEHAERPRPMA